MIDRHVLTFALLVVLVAVGLGSCAEERDDGGTYVQYVGQTMGTTYSVKHESTNGANLQPMIDSALEEVNMALSTYIPESVISQFNQNGSLEVPLNSRSEHFRRNLEASMDIHRRSEGAFDPTVGPLINAWGFGWEGRKPEAPTQEMLDSLVSLVGLTSLTYSVSGDSLYVGASVENMVLDMSAIAKGYGVDVVAELIEEKGVKDYFVEIGGEVRTRGVNQSGNPWVIGISRPEAGAAPTDFFAKVKLSGKSMATSGNYRNYYTVEGRKVWHTLNPVTGYPEENPVLSASIVYDNCMVADAMATACLVLGAERCMDFVQGLGGAAYLIVNHPDSGTVVRQTGFENYIAN